MIQQEANADIARADEERRLLQEQQNEVQKLLTVQANERRDFQIAKERFAVEQAQLRARISELENREASVDSRDVSMMVKQTELSKREEFLRTNENATQKQMDKMRTTRLQLEARRRDLEREKAAFSKLVESKRLGDDIASFLQEGNYGGKPSKENIQKIRDDLELEIRHELESQYDEKLRREVDSAIQERIKLLEMELQKDRHLLQIERSRLLVEQRRIQAQLSSNSDMQPIVDNGDLDLMEIDLKKREEAILQKTIELQNQESRLDQDYNEVRKQDAKLVAEREEFNLRSKRLDMRSKKLEMWEQRLQQARSVLDSDMETFNRESSAFEREKHILTGEKHNFEHQKKKLERDYVSFQQSRRNFEQRLQDGEYTSRLGGYSAEEETRLRNLQSEVLAERKKVEDDWAQLMNEKEKQLRSSTALHEQREEVLRLKKKVELEQLKVDETIKSMHNEQESLDKLVEQHDAARKLLSIERNQVNDQKRYLRMDQEKYKTERRQLQELKAAVEASAKELETMKKRLKNNQDRVEAQLKKTQEEKIEWKRKKQKIEMEIDQSQQKLERAKVDFASEKLEVQRDASLIIEGTAQLKHMQRMLLALKEKRGK